MRFIRAETPNPAVYLRAEQVFVSRLLATNVSRYAANHERHAGFLGSVYCLFETTPMPKNIEIKARIPDLAAIRARVAELATCPVQTIEQTDTYFVVPTG